jgi:hypothetical protein
MHASPLLLSRFDRLLLRRFRDERYPPILRNVERDFGVTEAQISEHHLAFECLNIVGVEHAFGTVGRAIKDRMAAPGSLF